MLRTSLSKALFSILNTSTCCSILALSSSGNFFMASRAFVIPFNMDRVREMRHVSNFIVRFSSIYSTDHIYMELKACTIGCKSRWKFEASTLYFYSEQQSLLLKKISSKSRAITFHVHSRLEDIELRLRSH